MRLITAASITLAIAVPQAAFADSLGSRERQRGVITKIDKGAKQLAVESTLILGYSQEGDDSSFMSNAVGSGVFRYFIKDNLGVSGRFGGIYKKSGDARDLGFVGAAWVNYYARMSEGMFFAPGAGLGVVSTQRDIPLDATNVARSSVLGGMAAAEFMLAVFLNPRFSITAGPEFVLTVGGTTPEEGDGTSFMSFNGAFKVGVGFAF
jgi:hypothetical protein